MHRGAGRAQILFFGLLCAAIVLLFVPDEHSGELRGRALSSLRPVLEFFSSGKPAPRPRPVSIEVVPANAEGTPAAPAVEQPLRPQPDDNPRMKLLLGQLDEMKAREIQREAEISRLKAEFPENVKALTLPAGLGADVIARKVLWQEPVLGLNRGTTDGVRLHAGVMHRGAVIGRIISAGPHASCMALLTHRGLVVSARLAECRAEGVLQGGAESNGEKLCKLAIVGRELNTKPGEQVITSGYDAIFPSGLWLGTVVSVKKKSDVQWEVLVRPACDESVIECVHVLSAEPAQFPWPAPAPKTTKSAPAANPAGK